MPLTDKQIKALQPDEKAKKYFDGFGLYLEVAPSGGKWWRFKYRFDGKKKRISLGTYPDVSLKEAREKVQEARKQVQQGTNPSVESGVRQGETQSCFETWCKNGSTARKGNGSRTIKSPQNPASTGRSSRASATSS